MPHSNNVTEELETLIVKLEAIGLENDYTVYADETKIAHLKWLLDNLFTE